MSKLLCIIGPTASGKTELACHVALQLDGEIISADSRQVYRGMDIGTGKDIDEYTIDGVEIPYHLIDIKDAGYQYNIAEYQLDFRAAYQTIKQKNRLPILCGGSGMYVEAALKGSTFLGIPPNPKLEETLKLLDPKSLKNRYDSCSDLILQDLNAQTEARMRRAIVIDDYITNNPSWKPRKFDAIDFTMVAVKIERDLRRAKITNRLSDRLNNGMIEEVEQLLNAGVTHEQLQFYGLEYKWLSRFLLKEISKKELFDGLNAAIHKFSKRQMTWFRRMEKHGYQIHWVDADQPLEQKVADTIAIFEQN